MTSRFLAAAALLVLTVPQGLAADDPGFDIDEHCAGLSNRVGGLEAIELACRELEAAARDRWRAREVTTDVFVQCVTAADGAYDSLDRCADDPGGWLWQVY